MRLHNRFDQLRANKDTEDSVDEQISERNFQVFAPDASLEFQKNAAVFSWCDVRTSASQILRPDSTRLGIAVH